MAELNGAAHEKAVSGIDSEDCMMLSVEDDEMDEFQYPSRPRPVKAEKSHRKKHVKEKSPRKRDSTDNAPSRGSEKVGRDERHHTKHASISQQDHSRPVDSAVNMSQESLFDLYRSLNMNLEHPSKNSEKYRLNALHIRGIDQMREKDVLRFFDGLDPLTTEWVSDTSCNVTFADDMAAAVALKTLSQPLRIITTPRNIDSELHNFIPEPVPPRTTKERDVDTGEHVYVSELADFPLPVPKGTWRAVRKVPSKAKHLLFRFARATDKSPENTGENGSSQYYSQDDNAVERITRHNSTSQQSHPRSTNVIYADQTRQMSEQRLEQSGVLQRIVVPRRDAATTEPSTAAARHRNLTPYDRPSPDQGHEDRPVRPGDLRYLLLHREEALPISPNDLRHRISGGVQLPLNRGNVHSRLGSKSNGGTTVDLRNRINLVRRMGPV